MSLYGPDCPNIELPAKAFYRLFTDCDGLQTAPKLPATELVEGCYANMFDGCSNLNEVWIYATGGFNTDDCLSYWLIGAGEGPGTIHCTSEAKTFFEGGGSDYSYGWTVTDDLP